MAGIITETMVGVGRVRKVSIIKSTGKIMTLLISSNKPGGGRSKRSEFAGANANTINARTAPMKDHIKRTRIGLRPSFSLHIQVPKIARNRTVIMTVVGGSEKPPMIRGTIKHTNCIQSDGTR